MLFEVARDLDTASAWGHGPAEIVPLHALDWTVIVPFFNERDFLARTLTSLAAQTARFALILVDNGSTDGSAGVAAELCDDLGLHYQLVTERRPGKVAALTAGLSQVRTRFVATCDADTWYPADYLVQAQALLDKAGCVAAGAYFGCPDDPSARRKTALHAAIMPYILRRQCLTGGAGQAFHTAALRRSGGFCADRWNYVLEDHEIIHRIVGQGRMRYGAKFWCAPAPRERNRDSIRWTLAERVLYHAAASVAGDWFFYSFLARRLRNRRMTSERIRERSFQGVFEMANGSARSARG
ncbi:MAG: glycosyltransferase family 2 protein [Sphingomonas sp.]